MGTPARYYSSTAVTTTLSASMGVADTSLIVASNSGFPSSYPFTLILEKDSANEEIVTVTGLSGSTYLITRGVDGTVARAHAAGTSAEHGVSALDFTDFRSHQAAAADVHDIGATASVVGTDTSQTLTNKTLTDPTINGGSVNADSVQVSGDDAVTETATQTLTNKTLAAPTINNGTMTGTSLSAPTIGDFSNAEHDHSTAAKGGNIPQSSVTGLVGDLATKETVANVDAHIADTTAHGATGAVVGTTNTQTLTNKTLTSPSITDPTVSGSVTATGATVSGGTLSGQSITGASLASDLDAATNKVTNVGSPTASADAATKGYVDSATVAAAGDSMTGDLSMGGNKVTDLALPTASTDAATRGYVDTTTVAAAGDSMTGELAMGGNKVTGVGDPTVSTDAANKGYVDAEIAAVVDAAPGALDTLNELASALGDDANFSSTVTNSIATKVAKAGDTVTGDLTMSGGATVKGVPDPTVDSDASNKAYTDTKVTKAGDSMTGDLTFSGGATAKGVPDPASGSDAANKTYTDTKVAKSGDTMTGDLTMSGGAKITGLPTPTVASDAAPKSYIDQVFGDTASAAQSDASAAQSAIAAATSAGLASGSAAAALASEQAAATSESNSAASASASASSASQSSTSASNSATSASQAAASQSAASASEIAAAASESAAAASESAAATSESNAATSEALAQDWAIKTDGTVDGTDFSAKYWAAIANVSNSVSADLVDFKGDLLAGIANNAVTRVPVGSDGMVLVADSSATTGVTWANTGAINLDGGSPSSFYGGLTSIDAGGI